MLPATEIQQKLFDFISRHVLREQRPPSYREMCKAVGLKSPSNVRYHLDALEELGYIKRDRGAARGVRVLLESAPGSNLVTVPMQGYILAGRPVFSDQIQEAIHLTRDIVPHLGPFYALRVKGDSMKDAQVNDGDIVVLSRQEPVGKGEMVAVRLTNTDEYTLKHFFRERGRIRLRPANPAYKDILVHPKHVEVQGRVVTVIRQYQ